MILCSVADIRQASSITRTYESHHDICAPLLSQVTYDADGNVFIDRPGKHFGVVLDYLRGMNVRFPTEIEELDQVEEEFAYYGLPVGAILLLQFGSMVDGYQLPSMVCGPRRHSFCVSSQTFIIWLAEPVHIGCTLLIPFRSQTGLSWVVRMFSCAASEY